MRLYWGEDEDHTVLTDAMGEIIAHTLGETHDEAVARAIMLSRQSEVFADMVAACEIALESRPRTADARKALVEVLDKVKQL